MKELSHEHVRQVEDRREFLQAALSSDRPGQEMIYASVRVLNISGGEFDSFILGMCHS
jgi:hypothetical protein